MSIDPAGRHDLSSHRPPGVFVPRQVLVIAGAVTAGLVTTTLVLFIPWAGVPVGTGLAAAGLLYTWLSTPRTTRTRHKGPAGRP